MTAPATILPREARDKLKIEAAAIRKLYKNPVDRQVALDYALARLREQYPHAFTEEAAA
jgi:hypothetical protein